jgi:hypothetical protein
VHVDQEEFVIPQNDYSEVITDNDQPKSLSIEPIPKKGLLENIGLYDQSQKDHSFQSQNCLKLFKIKKKSMNHNFRHFQLENLGFSM